MLLTLSPPRLYRLGASLSLSAVVYSIWLEQYQSLPPCPLCLISRWLLMAAGLFYITRIFFVKLNPYLTFFWYTHLVGIQLLGMLISARQRYLAYHPHPFMTCQAHLLQYTNHTALKTLIRSLFSESGVCHTLPHVFHVSLATWVFLLFSGLMVITSVAFIQERRVQTATPTDHWI